MKNYPGKIIISLEEIITPKENNINLGNGLKLVPIDMKDNNMEYSHLYKDDIKLSDDIFRKGGICTGVKDGYVSLIHYLPNKDKKNKEKFDHGTFVIVNEQGKICLSGKGVSDYTHHIGGNLGTVGKYIYDMRNGNIIFRKDAKYFMGSDCIVIEHRYSFHNTNEFTHELGIFKIDLFTCEISKICDI